MQVRRSRALLVAALLVLACAPFLTIFEQPAMVQAATTTSTGTPGTLSIRDTTNNPGAVCEHLVASNVAQVALTVNAPAAQAFSGDTARTIEWQPLIYQLFADGTSQLVASGSLQSRTVGFGTNAVFDAASFPLLPEGPVYLAKGVVTWRNSDGSARGATTVSYASYRSIATGSSSVVTGGCFPVMAAELSVSTSRVTVDNVISVSGRYFPISAPVALIWNGKTVATWTSSADGTVSGTLKIPATPIGGRTLQLNAGNWWKPGTTITVAPRIKMLPSSASRGQTVKISLRGYAQRESVRIRWKKGSSWVEMGWVTTSSTGSGELYITVPSWAPDGTSSIRGDGSVGRAQTNVASISGGAFKAASEATPSPTVTPTATPTQAGSPVVEPSVMPTETATIEPTATETPISTEPAEPTATEPSEGSPVAIVGG